jgi:hypothetical protein
MLPSNGGTLRRRRGVNGLCPTSSGAVKKRKRRRTNEYNVIFVRILLICVILSISVTLLLYSRLPNDTRNRFLGIASLDNGDDDSESADEGEQPLREFPIVEGPLTPGATRTLEEQLHWEMNLIGKQNTKQPVIPIFYNIFVPGDKADSTQHAFRIVQEQLQQVAASYAGNNTARKVLLFYTTVGQRNLLAQDFMSKEFCDAYPNFNCLHMAHLVTGTESYTLDRLQQYCTRHPTQRVTYLHSKGTFHEDRDNDHWRRALTMAATSRQCLEPPDPSCQLCGIHFFTQFSLMVPGNMFTVHCEYVTKLLSPLEAFPSRHTDAIGEALLLRLRRQITAYSLFDRKDYYGLDRYNSEHWIGKLW